MENAPAIAPATATVEPKETAYLEIVVDTMEKLTETIRLIREKTTYCGLKSFTGLFSSSGIRLRPYPLMEPIMIPLTKYFCKNG